MSSHDADRVARAGLSLTSEPTRQIAVDVSANGADAVWRRRGGDSERAVALLGASTRAGIRFVIPSDPDWPAALQVLAAYTAGPPSRDDIGAGRHLGVPFGLWVRGGELPPRRSVAIVGARAATAYGAHVATDLGSGFGERSVSVVSGAAYGIDAAAHRGALAVDGHTVAVLACGLDRVYPKGHDALIERIAACGSVVSEYPLGTPVRRQTFLSRNRLIAALAAGTVLVEAGHRSGARNTMCHAQRLELARFVVPGPVTSAMSAGCHAWLQQDREARLITDAADVLDEVGDPADLSPLATGPRDPRDGLGGVARDLLDRLPARREWPLERIAASCAVTTTEALGVVSALAAAGLVEQHEGGYRLTALGRAPTRRRVS